MHLQSTSGRIAGQSHTDLVLERLPSGELAWLRVVRDPHDDAPTRYWLTGSGGALSPSTRSLPATGPPWLR